MIRSIKRIAVALVLLLMVAIGYYAYAFINFANNIQGGPESGKFGNLNTTPINKTEESLVPPKWEGKERVNVLLLGGDSRSSKPNEIPRSDTLMVASIDPVTKKAALLSVLRDTYVRIPGYGNDRINASVTYGGPQLAMKTVSDLLGIPIQYYVYTDFQGFIALVDAIGGIEIDVEKDMKYTDSADGHKFDINLKKGYQHLDGTHALQYVRFRHDALSDFSRTERQRKFLQAVAQKMQSTTSIIRLPKILNSVDPYIETNLSTTDMLKLAVLAFDAKAEGMASAQVPPSHLLIEKRVGGADVLMVSNQKKLHAYLQDLFKEEPADETEPAGGESSTAGGGAPAAAVSNDTGRGSSRR
ncbi:LCP family protein [Paenibacillus ginsengihumi]|uniref:LCP family protein n=1 Tax=Paenibacillus ginsengihumi TaxID=431596 RepID=UPI000379D8B3|nr:LCP family protein [Paenibacillus ginsengihumi]